MEDNSKETALGAALFALAYLINAFNTNSIILIVCDVILSSLLLACAVILVWEKYNGKK